MKIYVTSGTGNAPTELAAFDAALNDAGIANYNLLRLSSVIPPNAQIINYEGKPLDTTPGQWGDRLYVVMAEMRASSPNTEAWAGIGWVQDEVTGRGLFVEHEGNSEAFVRDQINQSLKALMATRKVDFGPILMQVAGVTCTDLPVCALVVAVYEAQGWADKAQVGV